jgi:LPXTG-site transpeptidase (sortase) family protein
MLGFLLLLTWINALAATIQTSSGDGNASFSDNSLQAISKPQNGVIINDKPRLLIPLQQETETPTNTPTSTSTPTPTNTPTRTPTSTGFDFSVSKNNRPSVFQVGSQNVYEIIISASEYEPGEAQSIYIEDRLPEGVTWTPMNTSKWNCLQLSNSVSVNCFYSVTTDTIFDPLRFNVTISRTVSHVIQNTVRINTIPQDNISGNNTFTLSTTVDSVDLGLRKTVSPVSALITNTVTYTLVITNAGPATATSVVVADHIPSNLIYQDHNASPGTTYNPNTHQWNIPSIAPNAAPLTLTITTKLISGTNGQVITNRATASSSNASDWNPANNTASASIIVGDYTIQKCFTGNNCPKRNTVAVGEPYQYHITILNPPPNNLSPLVTDQLAVGLEFLGSTCNNNNNPSAVYSCCTRSSTNALSCSIYNNINIRVRASRNITTTEVVNTASLTWGPSGSRTTIHTDPVTTTLNHAGYFDLAKTDGISRVKPGQIITYTMTMTNVGDLSINNISVTDILQGPVTALRINTNNLGSGSCPSAQSCVLTLNGILDPGEKVSFQIAAQVNSNAAGNVPVINTFTANGTDEFGASRSGSASDTDTVDALTEYNLSAGKSVTPAQAKVDESFTFRIQLRNEGTVTIPDIVVKDTFPSVLDLTSVTTNRGTATLNTTTRSINVDVGDLTPGQGARIDVVAKVNSTATKVETYENRARVEFEGVTMHTNTIRFRVLPAATLPGTGWAPPTGEGEAAFAVWLNAAVGQMALQSPLSATQALLSVGLLVLLLGLLALLGSFLIRLRHPLRGGGTARLGLLLILLGVVFSVAGWAFNSSGEAQPPQLSMLAGAKPALATRMPPTATPTNRPTDTQTAAELQPPPTVTEVPAPILPTVTIDLSDLVDFHPTPTPNALPSYPIPTPTAYPTRGPGGVEPDASAATRLLIPSIGLDTVIKYVPFNGDTWLIGGLKQEIAWMGNTSWPGLGGNTGLAGHVDLADGSAGPFWKLKDLKPGDKVIVYTQKNILTYTVSEQRVVEDYDLSVVAPSEQPQITLITCTAWDNELRTYLKRLVVFATLLNVQPLAAGGS